MIVGGSSNVINTLANYSFVAGRKAQSSFPGCFVWGDSTTTPASSSAPNQVVMQGIHGTTTTAGIGVFVNSAGLLGTATSSIRFKENIKYLSKINDSSIDKNLSQKMDQLEPVQFTYKKDTTGLLHYGLIAEEVQQLFPELW